MKLVSFAIETWLGPMRRIGALIDGEQDGCIADFTSAYTNYLKREPMRRRRTSWRKRHDRIAQAAGGLAHLATQRGNRLWITIFPRYPGAIFSNSQRKARSFHPLF